MASLILLILFNCVIFLTNSLETDPNEISCFSLRLESGMGTELICTVNSDHTGVSLSEKYFLNTIVKESESQREFSIANFPRPIIRFILNIICNVSVENDALRAFPGLIDFEINGVGAQLDSSIDFDPNTFKYTPKLKALRLVRVPVTNHTILAIQQAINLEILKLEGCGELSMQPGMFDGMKNLKEISLRGNKITTIETDTFKGLSSVKRINLDNNNIEQLSERMLGQLDTLASLDISFNDIQNITADVFLGATGLIFLEMKENKIKTLDPNSFSGLTNLTKLVLDKNQLDSFPDDIFNNTPALEHLHLSFNKLSYINFTSFIGLENLERLDLKNNEIETIEAGTFDELGNLRTLSLGGNPIKTVPDGLFRNNEKLETIWLGDGTCIENLSQANFTRPVHIQYKCW